MTYLLISIPFLLVAAGIALVAHRRARRPGAPAEARMPWKAMLAAGALLMLLTAIFDTVIIGVGLVDYDESLILGWRIGLAPIEDFAYPLAGVILLPALWALLGGRRDAS
ncbi:lycopene cyclase domain-containing protein [Bogoriella caseilytica]|uniref:Lycopene cyclase domain-containing protein n=1 Tax=Bogoriella caseilytica TaxID=56055 RepID=A0A3N2BCQ1_9MICO|nr:lycopene cyclase domain-containing protein [Bogoriella caseilytica]ROR73026.1 lycopene cyclase domain-containing protein [Bogoriella caseilytica]